MTSGSVAASAVRVDRRFRLGERAVFVVHAISILEQCHGEVGILGDGIDLVAAGISHRRRYAMRRSRRALR